MLISSLEAMNRRPCLVSPLDVYSKLFSDESWTALFRSKYEESCEAARAAGRDLPLLVNARRDWLRNKLDMEGERVKQVVRETVEALNAEIQEESDGAMDPVAT